MGKMIYWLTLIIFVDLLFIMTGQNIDSITSVLFNAILNLAEFESGNFFKDFVGDIGSLFTSGTGIASLAAAATVTIGATFLTSSDTRLFVPIALALGLLTGDLIGIYTHLAKLNFILATVIMGPIIIIFAFTTIEWLRGKD